MNESFKIAMVYALSFVISGVVLTEVDFSRIFKKNKTQFAIILFVLCVIALAYLVGSFILVFI